MLLPANICPNFDRDGIKILQYDFCKGKPWLVVCCLSKDLAAKVKKEHMQNSVWTLVQWTQIQLFALVSFLFEMTVWGMQEQ